MLQSFTFQDHDKGPSLLLHIYLMCGPESFSLEIVGRQKGGGNWVTGRRILWLRCKGDLVRLKGTGRNNAGNAQASVLIGPQPITADTGWAVDEPFSCLVLGMVAWGGRSWGEKPNYQSVSECFKRLTSCVLNNSNPSPFMPCSFKKNMEMYSLCTWDDVTW
jgi:hypothetical protein